MSQSDLELRTRNLLSSTLGQNLSGDSNPSRKRIDAWDSIKHVELIFSLEEEFDVQFTEDEMAELSDLSQIVSVIGQKIGNK